MTRELRVYWAMMFAACLTLLALLVPQTPRSASDRDGNLHGAVVSAAGAPLEGVLVALSGSASVAVTDEHGEFVLTIPAPPPDRLVVTAQLPGYRAAEIAVAAPRDAIRIVLAGGRPTFRASVSGAATADETTGGVSRLSVSPLDVVRTAGTQADLMRELATMPGVTTIDDGTGLFVRGGDVSEVQVLFDGVVVNHPYRYETPTGGFRGAVDPFMTRDTTFTTGGFASPYGNALSAVVDMLPLDRPAAPQLVFTAGMAGVSASVSRPLGKQAGFRVALNRATPALLFSINPSAEPFDQYPGGWDASGAAYYSGRRLGNVRVFVLRQSDHVGVQLERDAFTGFLHSSTSHTLIASHWQKAAGTWLVSASAGTDRYSSSQDAGVLAIDIADVNISGRVDLSGRAAGWQLHTGTTFDLDRPNEHGSVPIVGEDFGGTAGVKTFVVDERSGTAGTFADAARTFGRLTPELGARVDYYSSSASWTADPRAAITFALTGRQRLRVAAGRYHQAPSSAYRDRQSGNPNLPPMAAVHAIVGYEFGTPAGAGTFFRVEAYNKQYTRLPLQTAGGYDAAGYGSARGLDVFVTHAWRLVTLRANGSWLDARRRWTPWDQRLTYPLPESRTWRPDFDIPYSFEAVAAIRAGHGITIDAAWRTAAGRPYTPAIGAIATPRGYEPTWAAINSGRLPRYERGDVSVSRSLRVGGRPAMVFATVGNVFDRDNVSAYSYSTDYRTRSTVPSGSPRSVYAGITIR